MNTRLLTVVKSKTKTKDKFRPRIRFSGKWLAEIGFNHGNLVSVNFDNGYLIFKAHDKGLESYGKLVKGILKNKMGLLQVSMEKQREHFEVKGLWLNNLGFTIGSVVAVQYEMNIIKAKLIDLSKVTVQI
jgi:hypothetical protein